MDSLLGAMLDVMVLQQEQMLLSFGHHARVNGKPATKYSVHSCQLGKLFLPEKSNNAFVPGLRRDPRGSNAPPFDTTPLHFLTNYPAMFRRDSAVQQVCSHFKTLQDVADRAALNCAQCVEPFRHRNPPQGGAGGQVPPQGGGPAGRVGQAAPANPAAPAGQDEEDPDLEMDLE